MLSPGLEVVAGALAGDPGAPAVTGDAVGALLWQQPWNELGKTLLSEVALCRHSCILTQAVICYCCKM